MLSVITFNIYSGTMKNIRITLSGLCFFFCLCACSQAPAEVILRTPKSMQANTSDVDILTSPTYNAVAVHQVKATNLTPLKSNATQTSAASPFDVAWNAQSPAPSPTLKQHIAPTPNVIHTASLSLPSSAEQIATGGKLTLGYSHQTATASVSPFPVSVVPTYKPVTMVIPTAQNSHKPSKINGFIWPVNGKIISRFGPKSGGQKNDGINISAAEGSPIHAVADGKVVYAGDGLKGYGNLLLIQHPGNWISAYAHTQSIDVQVGDTIQQGDVVAYVGQTGNVTTPQLHFALRRGKDIVNPERYLQTNVSSLR